MLKLIISILLVSFVITNDAIAFQKFMDFVHKYEKTYNSMEEFQHRFNVFKSKLQNVTLLGESYFDDGYAKPSITIFSDLTFEEYKRTYLTLKTGHENYCVKSGLKFLSDIQIPESLDYRALGKTSPVKDQYTCGSCWAFSVTGFMESQLLMKGQELQTLSEQQLVDCDRKIDQGCNGGLQEFALNYIQEKGIMPDMYYTYLGIEDECRYIPQFAGHKVKNVKCHEDVSIKDLKSYLNQIGPMSIALDATDFMDYDGGVLQCKPENRELNHAVLLVGYGSDNGKDYWIIKNSYGHKWAEQGYIRISQEEGKNCAIGIYVVSAELA